MSSSHPVTQQSHAAFIRAVSDGTGLNKRDFETLLGEIQHWRTETMVFKERKFHGETPEEIFPQDYADLETRVANCLGTVEGLDASDVSVVSKGNTIVLAGTVTTLEEADRAEDAARTVEGVAEIVNRITVA
jgi:Flp pilus assembly secretin CpaC